jgi:CRISPR-associated protein Cmr2
MSFDYYASIADQAACPKPFTKSNLSPCFADGCTVQANGQYSQWNCKDIPHPKKPDPKNDARRCYMQRAKSLNLEKPIIPAAGKIGQSIFEPSLDSIPFKNAIGIEVHFKLKSPWYSKDDRVFHVLDNPVRKDWVFGMPYMSATDWKGMLRWACRMHAGLTDYLRKHDTEEKRGKEPFIDKPWILHLFGNDKDEKKNFMQGALRLFPTFFYRVDFEVINPHSRTTKAGTQPIYYEAVPSGQPGVLHLLYTPARPKGTMATLGDRNDCLCRLVDAINSLLTEYGISAKRTSGWGACSIEEWRIRVNDYEVKPAINPDDCKNNIYSFLCAIISESDPEIPENRIIADSLIV